jgi:hypothetical protein
MMVNDTMTMKRTGFALMALIVVALAADRDVDAQGTVNFAGTWKLVKTDPPEGGGGSGWRGAVRGGTRALEAVPPTIVIQQSGNDMTFESRMSDGWARRLAFKLDFTMTSNALPEGGDGGEPRINGPTKTRGRWRGDELWLHLTQGLGQRRDILKLSGDTLTIRRDWETPGGSDTRTLVYVRAS